MYPDRIFIALFFPPPLSSIIRSVGTQGLSYLIPSFFLSFVALCYLRRGRGMFCSTFVRVAHRIILVMELIAVRVHSIGEAIQFVVSVSDGRRDDSARRQWR